MITGIPAYTSPVEQSLRCPCGRLYVVYLGGGIGDAAALASAHAGQLLAQFVDARQVPFVNCDCGEFLDFTDDSEPPGLVN